MRGGAHSVRRKQATVKKPRRAVYADAVIRRGCAWSGRITGAGKRTCTIRVIGRRHPQWHRYMQQYRAFIHTECQLQEQCEKQSQSAPSDTAHASVLADKVRDHACCFDDVYVDKTCHRAHFFMHSLRPCSQSRRPLKKRRQLRYPTTKTLPYKKRRGRPQQTPHFVVSAVLTVLYDPKFDNLHDELIDKFLRQEVEGVRTRRKAVVARSVQSILGPIPSMIYIDFICSTARNIGYVSSCLQIIKEVAQKHGIGVIVLRAMRQEAAFLKKYYARFGFKVGIMHLFNHPHLAVSEDALHDSGDLLMSCSVQK